VWGCVGFSGRLNIADMQALEFSYLRFLNIWNTILPHVRDNAGYKGSRENRVSMFPISARRIISLRVPL
jgi:hypothetical protein